LTSFFWPHYGPGVDSASNRNEYQEYFLGGKVSQCVGLTILLPSCAQCPEIWEHPTSWKLLGLSRTVIGWLYIFFTIMTQCNSLTQVITHHTTKYSCWHS